MLLLAGSLDAAKGRMTMQAEVDTPGVKAVMTRVTLAVLADELIFTIEMPGPGGTPHRMMRAACRRRGGGSS
jgi:hypothetical protein